MGDNTSWADLNRDGRRLERMIKICEANIDSERAKPTPELNRIWGYMDRLSRFTTNKKDIADIVLGLNKIIRKAKPIIA